jgi:hypothetical protein
MQFCNFDLLGVLEIWWVSPLFVQIGSTFVVLQYVQVSLMDLIKECWKIKNN